jgi:hypothetical protein
MEANTQTCGNLKDVSTSLNSILHNTLKRVARALLSHLFLFTSCPIQSFIISYSFSFLIFVVQMGKRCDRGKIGLEILTYLQFLNPPLIKKKRV